MGHENAGWIEDVGKDVTEFKKGDPVILHLLYLELMGRVLTADEVTICTPPLELSQG